VSGQANCLAGETAVGGGFNWTGGNVRIMGDEPVPSTGTPTGWKVTWNATVSGTVYVICVS
jgi:hypothetical protein